MRDDRDIQRPKPASAPEKGRGPHCGKDRRSATVCPCRHVPMCPHLARKPRESVPGVILASHLPRFSCESVPGVSSCLPPGTESLQKRSRCLILLPTWHGIPAKVFQVSFPAAHLARYSRESVPGSFSYRPPATVFLRKHVRCLFSVVHLPRRFISSRDVGVFQ